MEPKIWDFTVTESIVPHSVCAEGKKSEWRIEEKGHFSAAPWEDLEIPQIVCVHLYMKIFPD